MLMKSVGLLKAHTWRSVFIVEKAIETAQLAVLISMK